MITAGDLVQRHEEAARGRQFINVALVKHFSGTDGHEAMIAEFEARGGKSYVSIAKAAVTAIDSSSALAALRPLASVFVGAVDRESILSQLTGAITIPLWTAARVQVLNIEARTVAEGAQKLFGEMAFETASDLPSKIVAMMALTSELAKSLDPVALEGLRRGLVSAVAAQIDVVLCAIHQRGARHRDDRDRRDDW